MKGFFVGLFPFCFSVGLLLCKYIYTFFFFKINQNTLSVTLLVKYLIHRKIDIMNDVFQNLHLPTIPEEFQDQCSQQGIKNFQRQWKNTHIPFVITFKIFHSQLYSKYLIFKIDIFHHVQRSIMFYIALTKLKAF